MRGSRIARSGEPLSAGKDGVFWDWPVACWRGHIGEDHGKLSVDKPGFWPFRAWARGRRQVSFEPAGVLESVLVVALLRVTRRDSRR
jgi:hypothetical protein